MYFSNANIFASAAAATAGQWSIRINQQYRLCFLREEYLEPLGLSVHALAQAHRVPAPRINDIVRERRGITPDTALRLARYFGGDAESWLNLQLAYELRKAEAEYGAEIAREVRPRAT